MPKNATTEQFLNDLGPAEITYKGSVWGKTSDNPEGGTHGGIIVKYDATSVDTMRDAEGNNPHDSIFVGQNFSVDANLAGMSLTQLKDMFPNASLVGAGPSKKLVIGNPVGKSMRANAGVLIIKPIIDGEATDDQTLWIVFDLAFPIAAMEVPFDLENQKVTKVTFKIFHDLTTGVLAEWSHSTSE